MAAHQTTPRSLTSIAGALLLAFGFLILLSNLDAAGARIVNAAGTSGGHLLEMLPVLVLALLHGLQAYVFDHAGFLSGLLQFLVSFWPLILILAGALLLRDVLGGRLPAYKPGTGSSNAKGADA
jgi:thiamine transporter ThiT